MMMLRMMMMMIMMMMILFWPDKRVSEVPQFRDSLQTTSPDKIKILRILMIVVLVTQLPQKLRQLHQNLSDQHFLTFDILTMRPLTSWDLSGRLRPGGRADCSLASLASLASMASSGSSWTTILLNLASSLLRLLSPAICHWLLCLHLFLWMFTSSMS